VTKEEQLQQARAELDAINQVLATLEAEQAEALASSSAYAKWRGASEGAELERERLALLVEKLSADLEQEKADAARSALASRKEDIKKRTIALARRIAEEGARAAAMLVQLATDAAANAVDVERLNRELTEDEQLVPADQLARHRNPVPREDLEATFVDLWTYESNGQLISDQDAVVERSRDRGYIPGTEVRRTPTHVVRKHFKQVRYLAPGDREYFEPLISLMRLPNFNRPGMMFDHGRVVEEPRAARRELVELTLVSDAPAKPAASEVA